MKIEKHILSDSKKPCMAMTPHFIAIHETGNDSIGADADAHKRFLDNTDTKVCWHFTVDDMQVIQHLEINEQGWHIGDGDGIGNTSAIGIEICINQDGNYDAALDNAATLCAFLMEELGWIPIVQHYDFQKSNGKHKNCPRNLRGLKNGWLDFLRRVENVVYNGD